MAGWKDRHAALVAAGCGIAIEGVAVYLLILHVRRGDPPIAAGLALMVVGLAVTMFGVTVGAAGTKKE